MLLVEFKADNWWKLSEFYLIKMIERLKISSTLMIDTFPIDSTFFKFLIFD